MSEEILEVEVEMENGQKKSMKIREVDLYLDEDIKRGTKGILTLVNGQQMFILISQVDSEGVSFKIENGSGDRTYYYEESVISSLYVEV